MLGGKRAIGGAERVVVEAVAGDDQNDGEGEHPRKKQAELVAALGILAGKNGALYASFGTHGLSPKVYLDGGAEPLVGSEAVNIPPMLFRCLHIDDRRKRASNRLPPGSWNWTMA